MRREKREVVYKTKKFNLERTIFTRKGRKAIFYRLVGANSVTVLPILSDGRVLLERQFRYAINKYIYELPAGHIDPGESASYAVARELEEETGYVAGRLKLLFKGYPSPGSKTEFASYYLATGVKKKGKKHLEIDEIVDVKVVTLKRAFEMIKKNEIMDLKTIATLLYYKAFEEK